jgi:PiT family inorganic phosphate transporter
MLRYFRAFLPKEERFFDLFARHTQTVVQGAEALQDMLRGGEETLIHCQRVSHFEGEADAITREVLTAVRRTFITPFDRVDIKNLITSMDDAIDQMQQTAKAVVLFEVREFEPPMREIGALLVESANLVGRALPLMKAIGPNLQMLTAMTEEITKLEGRVDDLHDIGLKELFLKHRHANTMDYIVGAEIYDHLEKVADRFDDAANSIATIVSTRVLRPQYAVFWAAFFNFIAFMVFGLHVANTIGTGIIQPGVIDSAVIFAALTGAIVWNLVTWALGIPSSSSHALIGGLLGAGLAKAGLSAAVWSGLTKALVAIVLSPLVGFLLALVLVAIVSWASVRSTPFAVDRAFRILQFASASLYSLGHGGNDAQKTMGIIAVLLYSQGYLGSEFSVPFWVVLSCQAAMALGTLMGGWRIVRTMGLRITKLTPMQGFCAETGGAATLFMATFLGVPVSTTHTITGAIVGVGAARRMSAVRWNVASSIVYAWVITIPAAAAVAALAYWATRLVPSF